MSLKLPKDIGEEIIQKLEFLNDRLDDLLGDENGEEEFPDSFSSRE